MATLWLNSLGAKVIISLDTPTKPSHFEVLDEKITQKKIDIEKLEIKNL